MLNHTPIILVIEDDPQDFELVEIFLAKAKFRAIIENTETLQTGREYLERENIDLVILDLSLPDGQGLETFRRIYDQFPHIPIIVLSGLDHQMLATTAVREGAQDYLVKGEFNSDLLVKSIRYAIERQHQRLELENTNRSLQASEMRFHTMISQNADGILIVNREGIVLFANPAAEALLGFKADEMIGSMFGFPLMAQECTEVEIVRSEGELTVAEMHMVEITWDDDIAYLASLRNITARKQAEKAVQLQAEREKILFSISKRIRQSLDMNEILQTATDEVRQFLKCDRVVIYGCGNQNYDFSLSCNICKAESISDDDRAVARENLKDDFLITKYLQTQKYNTSFKQIIYTDSLNSEDVSYITSQTVNAHLIVPIIKTNEPEEFTENHTNSVKPEQTWGLLIAYHYRDSRQWHKQEIDLLKRLALQLSIAIKQAELYQKLEDANQELKRLACCDPLTNVYNRRHFDEQLNLEWRRMQRSHLPLSVIMIDIDCFKAYNDTYGHQGGDSCLRVVSNIISRNVRRGGDFVARYGGEEFVVVLPNTDCEGAYQVAETIRAQVKEKSLPHSTSSVSNMVTLSLGVASMVPHEHSTTAMLIEAADRALYLAKERGRDRSEIYQSDFSEKAKQSDELEWVKKLRQGLEENRFCLYTQSIRPLKALGNKSSGDEMNNYEILLRFVDDNGTVVPPGIFLPIAEHYNLMPQIDRWVIHHLFSHLAENDSQDWQNCCFAINLSGATLNDDQFLHFMHQQFDLFNLPPSIFCFEVTETVAVSNLTQASEFINSLKAMGCRFALDDFGTGMSSFAYLKNLPVDYVKIDGSFVKDIVSDPAAKAIVAAIHNVGKVMGLNTVAEFVETEIIMDTLDELQVDYAQGYYFDKPSPLDYQLSTNNYQLTIRN